MAPTSRVTQEKGELVSAGGRCAGSACRCRPLALKGRPVLSTPTVWACSAVWRGGAARCESPGCKRQLASGGKHTRSKKHAPVLDRAAATLHYHSARTRPSALRRLTCLEGRPRGAQVRGLRSLGSAGQRLRHRYLSLTDVDQ